MPRSPSPSTPWSSGSARSPRSSRRDPDVASVASFVGAGTVNATMNTGRLYINLKPRDQRKRRARARSSSACATPPHDVQGISLFMQAVQDVQIDSRVSRTQYQYTLQDADAAELADWAAKLLAKLRTAAGTRRCRQRPAAQRPAGQRERRSREGLAPQHPAASDRRHALRRVRPAAGLDHLHAAQPVPRHSRSRARSSSKPRRRSTRSTSSPPPGRWFRSAPSPRSRPALRRSDHRASRPVPGRDALVQLAPGQLARATP